MKIYLAVYVTETCQDFSVWQVLFVTVLSRIFSSLEKTIRLQRIFMFQNEILTKSRSKTTGKQHKIKMQKLPSRNGKLKMCFSWKLTLFTFICHWPSFRFFRSSICVEPRITTLIFLTSYLKSLLGPCGKKPKQFRSLWEEDYLCKIFIVPSSEDMGE